MAKDKTGRLHVTVRTGGKRKLSSKLWLERQLNDPYVAQAKRDGYRSRAAYKLLEIDDKYQVLKPGMVIMAEPNPITPDGLFGIFLGHTFIVTDSGHEVVEAPDGETALALMKSERPRVVLQDLMLPDADGFELVGKLRRIARGTDVSILAFSGFVSELDEARISKVGFDDIIAKPIAPSRLASVNAPLA